MVISLLFTDLMNQRLNMAARKSKIVILGLIITLLATYSTMTIARNMDWKDGLSLWSKTLETTPNTAAAHGNLGRAYLEHDLNVLNLDPDNHSAADNIRKAKEIINKNP